MSADGPPSTDLVDSTTGEVRALPPQMLQPGGHVEGPDTVHGRLLESVHLSGYSFERACSEFEWLLDDGRRRQVGGGFDRIDDFLATVDLSEFRMVVEQRRGLHRRLVELQASQRATAAVTGSHHTTVGRDLNATDGAAAPDDAPEVQDSDGTGQSVDDDGAAAPIVNDVTSDVVDVSAPAEQPADERWWKPNPLDESTFYFVDWGRARAAGTRIFWWPDDVRRNDGDEL